MHKVNFALLVFSLITLVSSTGFARDTRQTTGGGESSAWREIADKVDLVCLFVVEDGRVRRECLAPKALASLSAYQVNGYISGIVAFCRQEMDIRLEGQLLSPIRQNGDGTFSIKYFGKLRPDDIVTAGLDQGYYEGGGSGDLSGKGGGALFKTGYSFFPKVTGDAVSARETFGLSFSAEEETVTLPFRQAGCIPLGRDDADPAGAANGISFHYFGTDLERLARETPDFQQRLDAIAQGIREVEEVFNARLVERINILDYRGIHNAVTCKGRREIWVYVDAFQSEPVAELSTIAQHETLHKFVTAAGLVRDSGVRELFADLKGFGLFSMERFLLMTKGIAGREASRASSEGQAFFSFINEQNFLEDRKGGHSHENLDEFCTSFLHSLMYVERFRDNLDRPVRIYGTSRSRTLSGEEKSRILELYAQTITTLMEALEKQGRLARAPQVNLPLGFFADCLEHAEGVRQERGNACLVMPGDTPAS